MFDPLSFDTGSFDTQSFDGLGVVPPVLSSGIWTEQSAVLDTWVEQTPES